ncbi:DUF4123 domain-containing protein [Marinobacter bohaiensis]|uniref:DUF4123 domain-containing protein n=1 Tax=Marinobacter bohaiensis TaxID=2201898 RepID=UPI000DAF46BE|nr:DUF4123 domain-containing protein [Marinobacter bohaiensis]
MMEQSKSTELDREAIPNEFLLLDGAMIDALMITYKYDDSPWVEWLYRNTRHESAIEVSPLLVKPSAKSRLWENLGEWSKYGIVLKTKATTDTLLGHLRSLISVRLPSGQLSYCRFYSQSHLPNLLNAMNDGERATFSGPVETWENPSPNADWHAIPITPTGSIKQPEDEGWFQLTRKHIDQINGAKKEGYLKKLAAHLRMKPDEQSFSTLNAIVQQAETHAFSTEKDIARYTEMAIQHGERLKAPECQSLLANNELTNIEKLSRLDHLLAYGGA